MHDTGRKLYYSLYDISSIPETFSHGQRCIPPSSGRIHHLFLNILLSHYIHSFQHTSHSVTGTTTPIHVTAGSIPPLLPSFPNLELTVHSTTLTSTVNSLPSSFPHKITLDKCNHWPNSNIQIKCKWGFDVYSMDTCPSDKVTQVSSSLSLDGNSCDAFPNCPPYHQILHLLCLLHFFYISPWLQSPWLTIPGLVYLPPCYFFKNRCSTFSCF